MREGALSRQDAERLVEIASTAPSTQNLQPWRFVARLSDRVIEVYADPARALRRADPRGRAVHIACGAALFNLRLAIAHAGAEPVARLLPNPRDPLLLAAVRIAGPHRPRPGERDLYAAATSARTAALLPRLRRTAAPGMLPALAEAAALEGASLRVLDRTESARVAQSLLAADPAAHSDPRRLAELTELLPAPLHLRPAGKGGGRLAVLSSTADDRAAWLRVGQALQRVLLLATHRGVPTAPVSAVTEQPDHPNRPDPRFASAYPEMILRIGPEPAGLSVRPASRRPVAQVMRVVGLPARQDEGPRRLPPPALAPALGDLLSSK